MKKHFDSNKSFRNKHALSLLFLPILAVLQYLDICSFLTSLSVFLKESIEITLRVLMSHFMSNGKIRKRQGEQSVFRFSFPQKTSILITLASSTKMKNPFQNMNSPIQQLYERARSKSQNNRLSTRSRSTSYREFQVGIIQQALKRNHIINKEYHGEQKKSVQRERLQSKYFGVESQRYQSPKHQQSRQHVGSVYFEAEKENQPIKSVRFQRCDQSYLETMVNLGEIRNGPYSRKKMAYESNFLVDYPSEATVDDKSSKKILSSKKLQNSKSKRPRQSNQSRDRKCSITLKLSEKELPLDKLKRLQQEASKKKIDCIREEYFDTQIITKANSQGRIINREAKGRY